VKGVVNMHLFETAYFNKPVIKVTPMTPLPEAVGDEDEFHGYGGSYSNGDETRSYLGDNEVDVNEMNNNNGLSEINDDEDRKNVNEDLDVFSHQLSLNCLQMFQIAIMSLTLAPIRFVVVCMSK
jgi:hypothetical protein